MEAVIDLILGLGVVFGLIFYFKSQADKESNNYLRELEQKRRIKKLEEGLKEKNNEI